MTLESCSRRPGITLLEVLTAIFIMGIGMMALLTLFPTGAISMGRAIRDDRAAAIAANAGSLARAQRLASETSVINAFEDIKPGNTDGPTSPILVDRDAEASSSSTFFAPNNRTKTLNGILRVVPSWPNPNRFFTFQDEIQFDPFGFSKGAPGTFNRPGTFSLAYLLRRPVYNLPTTCEMSVLVFAGRDADLFTGETVLPSAPSGVTAVSLDLMSDASGATLKLTASGRPDIRQRSWVLDTTVNSGGYMNGCFYRVEALVEDPASPSTFRLILDRPIRTPDSPMTASSVSSLLHFREIIAVVERQALSD